MEGIIRTLFIFEILGKPPEHIKDSLNQMIDDLAKQKGVEIVRKEVHDAKEVENKNKDSDGKLVQEGLYSSFAEVEVDTDDINLVLAIVMNMLPAHVEILQPTEYKFKNFELSTLLTELTVKVHRYDEVAKVLMMERNQLVKRLGEAEEKIKNFEGEVKGE